MRSVGYQASEAARLSVPTHATTVFENHYFGWSVMSGGTTNLSGSSCRAVWLTDIHLNFLCDRDRAAFDDEHRLFVDEVLAAIPDAILIGGDIAEGPELLWPPARRSWR